jgi:signal peptidase I
MDSTPRLRPAADRGRMSEPIVETQSEPGLVRVLLVGRKPGVTLIRIVVLALTSFLVFRFVLLPIRVQGVSMLPTYKEPSVNFVNRMAYSFHAPRRGDVVAVRTSGLSIMYMKRIVGLPGETIAFRGGRVLINGKPLDEPYVKLPTNWNVEPEVVQPDHYYCVGDNRSMPPQDHEKGQAERSRIVGKVLL